jgi:hypothetical protein
MKNRIIGNVTKYKYDWLSVIFFTLLLTTQNVLFLGLFFISVCLSELKK